jgi:hypothetical protein
MTKKIIDVLRKYESVEDLMSGPIDDVIARLQKVKEEKQTEGVQLILEYETDYGSYGDSDRQVVNLYDRRLETDEEYQERVTKEAAEKERALNAKRVQLERLKKELGES